jgi:putative transcriptional regulator
MSATGGAWFTGQLLVAMPSMGDPRFAHSVIAVIRHDEDGAMGIAIGQPADFVVSELLDQAGLPGTVSPDPWVLIGGPVEAQRGFVIHSRDWGGEGTIDVAGKFAMSGSLDILRALSEGRGPSQWQVALGYAGWGPGQLEEELIDDAWHLTHLDQAIIFDITPERRWHAVMARDGIDPARVVMRGGSA